MILMVVLKVPHLEHLSELVGIHLTIRFRVVQSGFASVLSFVICFCMFFLLFYHLESWQLFLFEGEFILNLTVVCIHVVEWQEG